MHWVVQREIFSKSNADSLLEVLQRANIPHSVVSFSAHESKLDQDLALSGRVYVCGAQRLANVAVEHGWLPGSFLTENFEHSRWVERLGDELLNQNATITELKDLTLTRDMFVRPVADSKVFDGQVFTPPEFESFKAANVSLQDVEVLVSAPRQILREYRLFVVQGKLVTGSQYRSAGQVYLSPDLDPEVCDYAQSIIERWQPAEAFVLDVALTSAGFKIIEFNNINSSGFYASDVARYVDAIETAFA